MAVLVPTESTIGSRVILYIIVIVIIVAIIWAIWQFVYKPWRAGTLTTPPNVRCSVAPAVPLGLTVTNQSNNRAYIKWQESANTDTYNIYVGDYSNFALSDAERVINTRGNSFIVLNLVPKTYYFKINAVNSCGTSGLSGETPLVVTSWPSIFKLCKSDKPNVCITMQAEGGGAQMSEECNNNNCIITYDGLQKIKRENANLCVTQNDQIGVDFESPVETVDCGTASNWNIDLNTGRITSGSGLCFGADSIIGTDAYNTTCSAIFNPADARYQWDVIAMTN